MLTMKTSLEVPFETVKTSLHVQCETAQLCLNVLSEASALSIKCSDVSGILCIEDKLTTTYSFLGSEFGFSDGFLPVTNHEEILCCFLKLCTMIDHVRDDILELEKMIKWDIAELKYGVIVDLIKQGMQCCFEIGVGIGKKDKLMHQEKLKELCGNKKLIHALDRLIEGITGNGAFRTSILDNFYEQTKGDRPKISAFATRLLQLVCGGMIVFATFETVMCGKECGKEISKKCETQLKEVFVKVQSIVDRCVSNYKENMLIDLNMLLDTGRGNDVLVTELTNLVRDKYDWLENYCLIFDAKSGQYFVDGSCVESLNRNGKCGVIFCRPIGKPPRCPERFVEAWKAIDLIECDNAVEGGKNILAKLGEIGFEWIGLAVVKRGLGLWYDGTFTTKVIQSVGKNAFGIIPMV